ITELLAHVENGRVEIRWEYEYHEDTDEIPTQEELDKYSGQYNPPEYFFTIKAEGVEYGKKQESGLLKFKDWINISLVNIRGEPVAKKKYTLRTADGQERTGTLDGGGRAREENLPPGGVTITFDDSGENQYHAT
ncbi:MAG: hypothetical protein KAW46_01020, partial [candidate division Zixibacteria bacterium]|nr:hypothetical protein [candidate division Zixibacteria bacterium]